MKKTPVNVAERAQEIIECVGKGAFLTTMADGKVNTMVIGWGHVGIIWRRPFFLIYVRKSRFTSDLLAKNPEFTINVPINGFTKEAFTICGSKSGRDMDKITEAGLTTVDPEVISVPGIKEFPLTLECRVACKTDIDSSALPDAIREDFYTSDTSEHIAYYGEILSAYQIEE